MDFWGGVMTRKLRIALVMPELFHGGAESQFRLLLENLDPQRYEVTVILEQSYSDANRRPGEAWLNQHGRPTRFVRLNKL